MKKEEKLEKKVVDDGLGKIPILDPNAKSYRKYLIIPVFIYILYLLVNFIVLCNNGTMNRACLVDSPICFLGTTSIYYEPLLFIIIFALAILLLLNIAGLLYEPIVYISLFLEMIMIVFFAFVNIYLVILYSVIIVLKILYLYYDNKDKEIFGLKI